VHPVLIEIGRFKLYSYGLMLALSFWVGILWAAHRASKKGVKAEAIYDLSIILILAAVLGSRTLYILTHRADYHSLLDVVALWQGGATFYGGFILALAGAFVFLRKKRIPFLLVADVCSPSIALGYGFTRIGCFLSGCCFGRPAGSGFGVVFPAHSPAGYLCPGVPLQPTQLYASLGGIVIAGLLILIERKSPFKGFLFALLCILYGAERFIEDIFRYYEPSARLGRHLTQSQAISVCLAAAGLMLLVVLSARARNGGVASSAS
jgi:phosphatidylglycerol---prolipoprotein diacylglyceryl transferase